MLKDPYKGVVLAHTLIDWSDPKLTAEAVTIELCGYTDHWYLPEFEGMKRWEIEKKILFEGGRSNWAGVSKYDVPYFQHMLLLIHLLLPETDITPSFYDAVNFFCIGIGGGNKKILNLIGSLSSGKSRVAMSIAYACMAIDPEYTAVYIANPFENVSSSGIWGDCEELLEQLNRHYPPTKKGKDYSNSSSIFPTSVLYAARAIDFIPGVPKAARMEIRNVKHVGKFKGVKSRGKDVNRGIILVLLDECNEIENLSFLTTLTNIAAQDSFFCITTQNFKGDDMGSMLTEPSGHFDGPATFDELNIDTDIYWASKSSSQTLRFDGLKSPNILAGRDIYPKLFRKKDLDRITLDYGAHSPHYASQVRSFPQRNDEVNTVLTTSQIKSSRHEDTYFTVLRKLGSFSFADPAFGGRDAAVYLSCDWCICLTTDAEGFKKEEELLVFKERPHVLKLTRDCLVNDWMIERLKNAKVPVNEFTIGADFSFEEQIALQMLEHNQRLGIPAANCGYDFSMRHTIVSAINKIIGFNTVGYDYNQGPLGTQLKSLKQNSLDCCKDRTTELAFLTADFFVSKQIRGGHLIETCVNQLSRTRYEIVNKKFVAEKKREWKIRNGGLSPDFRDTLMGVCGLAAMRGFNQHTVGHSGSGGKSLFAEINASNKGKSKVGKRW